MLQEQKCMTTADKGEVYLIKIMYDNSSDRPKEKRGLLFFPLRHSFSTLATLQLPLQIYSKKAKTMYGPLPFAIKVQKCSTDNNARLLSQLCVVLGGYYTSKGKTVRKIRE